MDDFSDNSSDGHVIFSLTVNSLHAIQALAHLPGRVGDEFWYEVHQSNFTEIGWSARAGRLDEAINEAINALESSNVDLEELHHPDVFVRAFFTFAPGAETIRAEAVQRLAAVNATIWIDANA